MWLNKFIQGVEELQRYFAHVEDKLRLKKDMYLNTRVVTATFDESTDKWLIECDSQQGKTSFLARFFIPCIGFAAKRHIPDWPGIDSFKGEIYHSSFWPGKVDVSGKKMAVIGQGATGVQIAQECAREIGSDGELTVFVRTPNIALAMQQAKIDPAQIEKDRPHMGEMLKARLETPGGFHWHGLDKPVKEFTPEEREELFEEMWQLGGFRILTTFNDILLDEECNRHTYDFWARKVRARIDDPQVKDILAPLGMILFAFFLAELR
jgi:cation diffusion facilitator CzcD-associated flavoprotein CzcO